MIKPAENPTDRIGNRTDNLQARSAFLQPNALPRVPICFNSRRVYDLLFRKHVNGSQNSVYLFKQRRGSVFEMDRRCGCYEVRIGFVCIISMNFKV
jgi:hypothetical protein